jgi:hypothetical protein
MMLVILDIYCNCGFLLLLKTIRRTLDHGKGSSGTAGMNEDNVRDES